MKMWNRSLSIVIAAAAIGCSATGPQQDAQHGSLTATIAGGAGKTLYFNRFLNNAPSPMDSIVLDDKGQGRIPMPAIPLDFYALSLKDGKDLLVLLTDSAEQLVVSASADSLAAPTKVEGSANTILLQDYFSRSRLFDKERSHWVEQLQADRSDTAAMARLNAMAKEFTETTTRFIQANPTSPAVLAALNRLDIRTELPLFTQARKALATVIPNSPYYISFREQVDRAGQQAEAARMQEEQQAKLDGLIPVGSTAPDFSQSAPDGKPIALSDLRGKVVLIDFWASWCRPCRMEMPNVKKAYAAFHGKGFEILGVSLDQKKEAWTGAIAQDGLPWKHVSDLAFWNNAAAQLYGVTSIPYTVLVDKDGKVLAKNLRGPALEAKLAEVLR